MKSGSEQRHHGARCVFRKTIGNGMKGRNRIKNNLYDRVEFLTSREELFLYAKAIYSAMIWGREVNEQNRIIQEKNNSVK